MGPSDMDTVFSLKKALRKATTATLKQLDQAHVQQQCESQGLVIDNHPTADDTNL